MTEYWETHIGINFLTRRMPFVAQELRRQNRLRAGDTYAAISFRIRVFSEAAERAEVNDNYLSAAEEGRHRTAAGLP